MDTHNPTGSYNDGLYSYQHKQEEDEDQVLPPLSLVKAGKSGRASQNAPTNQSPSLDSRVKSVSKLLTTGESESNQQRHKVVSEKSPTQAGVKTAHAAELINDPHVSGYGHLPNKRPTDYNPPAQVLPGPAKAGTGGMTKPDVVTKDNLPEGILLDQKKNISSSIYGVLPGPAKPQSAIASQSDVPANTLSTDERIAFAEKKYLVALLQERSYRKSPGQKDEYILLKLKLATSKASYTLKHAELTHAIETNQKIPDAQRKFKDATKKLEKQLIAILNFYKTQCNIALKQTNTFKEKALMSEEEIEEQHHTLNMIAFIAEEIQNILNDTIKINDQNEKPVINQKKLKAIKQDLLKPLSPLLIYAGKVLRSQLAQAKAYTPQLDAIYTKAKIDRSTNPSYENRAKASRAFHDLQAAKREEAKIADKLAKLNKTTETIINYTLIF